MQKWVAEKQVRELDLKRDISNLTKRNTEDVGRVGSLMMELEKSRLEAKSLKCELEDTERKNLAHSEARGRSGCTSQHCEDTLSRALKELSSAVKEVMRLNGIILDLQNTLRFEKSFTDMQKSALESKFREEMDRLGREYQRANRIQLGGSELVTHTHHYYVPWNGQYP